MVGSQAWTRGKKDTECAKCVLGYCRHLRYESLQFPWLAGWQTITQHTFFQHCVDTSCSSWRTSNTGTRTTTETIPETLNSEHLLLFFFCDATWWFWGWGKCNIGSWNKEDKEACWAGVLCVLLGAVISSCTHMCTGSFEPSFFICLGCCSMDSKSREESAKLLGCLIEACERLMTPYIVPVLLVCTSFLSSLCCYEFLFCCSFCLPKISPPPHWSFHMLWDFAVSQSQKSVSGCGSWSCLCEGSLSGMLGLLSFWCKIVF